LLKRKYRYFSFDLLLKENQKKISNRKSKFLEESKSTCLSKDYHFTIDTKYVPHSSELLLQASGMAACDDFMSLEKY
jgi:hypothetical protein